MHPSVYFICIQSFPFNVSKCEYNIPQPAVGEFRVVGASTNARHSPAVMV